jgi:hypothetical protein
MSFEDSDLHQQAEDNYLSTKKENSYKLAYLENTENTKEKTDRETKIKSQRVTILLRTASVNTRQIWKEILIISCFRLSERVL